MTQAVLSAKLLDRAALARAADLLALLVAVSLPWSTSATSVLLVLWALALGPTLTVEELRRAVATPAGGLPVMLWLLALIGMSWGHAPMAERFDGFVSFLRLLAIPLLLVQFQRSDYGMRVAGGFLAACVALLLLSWPTKFWPGIWWPVVVVGVPVKEYITQSGEFLLCTFALAHCADVVWRQNCRRLAMGLALLALGFFANIVFVATARATLVTVIVLVMVFALQHFGWRGSLAIALGAFVIAAIAWMASPYLRQRVLAVGDEIEVYRTQHTATSSGYRIEFWAKSLKFIATAPIFGHGTGTISEQFREDDRDGKGLGGATDNPHNQTLFVAVQFGLIGVGVLYAMWISHLLLFRAGGLAGWIGAGVVIQNIVMSLFNTQIFAFGPGWLYVFGVGVLGGMVLRERGRTPTPLA